MQSGVHRTLYDGPILAKNLRELKPHAGCYGKECRKIVQCEDPEAEWRYDGGKPYCGECFEKKG